jgi:hypothetical protein
MMMLPKRYFEFGWATLLFLSACSPKAETKPNPTLQKTMISIEELSTRSRVDFKANAQVIGQNDHIGTLQQAQSWVIKTSSARQLPSSAESMTTLDTKILVAQIKATVPNYDFDEPVEQNIPSYYWVVSGSSWSVNSVKSSTGYFVQVDWIKQTNSITV